MAEKQFGTILGFDTNFEEEEPWIEIWKLPVMINPVKTIGLQALADFLQHPNIVDIVPEYCV